MIAVEHQQRAVRAQIERIDQRAEQSVRIADVADILRDRIIRLGKPARSVGIVRLHGHGHGEKRLPGLNRLLDLANECASDRTVADIGSIAIHVAVRVLGHEALEAELQDRPVAAEEAWVVRVEEQGPPAARTQPRGERGLDQPVRAQIGVESIHALRGEGDAREHLDLGAVRVGAEARDLQPAAGEGAATQAVERLEIGCDTLPSDVAERFRLDDDDRAIAVAEARGPSIGMRRADTVRTPKGEATDQGGQQAEITHQIAGRGAAQRLEHGKALRQGAGEQQRREADAAGQNERLHAVPEQSRLLRGPDRDESNHRHDEQGNSRRFAPAEIEQSRVANKCGDESKIAEHQRLSQVAKFHPRNADEDRQRDQAGRRREEGAGRGPQPQKKEAGNNAKAERRYRQRARGMGRVRHSLALDPAADRQNHAEQGRQNANTDHHLIHFAGSSSCLTADKLVSIANTHNTTGKFIVIFDRQNSKYCLNAALIEEKALCLFSVHGGQMETEARHE